jgi:FHA domain
MLKLEIKVSSQGEVVEFNLDRENITIGRRHDNDIRLNADHVSAYHAEFTRGNSGEYYIRDRDSLNGTFLNGETVEDRIRVSEGDILNFGSLTCRLVERRDNKDFPEHLPTTEGTATISNAVGPDTETFRFERLNNASEKLAYQKRDIIALQHAINSLELEQIEKQNEISQILRKLEQTRVGFSHTLDRARHKLNLANQLRTCVQSDHRRAVDQVKTLGGELARLQQELNLKESELLRPHVAKLSKLEEEMEELKSENAKLHREKDENHLYIDELEQKLKIRQEQGAFSRKGLFFAEEKPAVTESDSEQTICRELIGWLEHFDTLMESYRRNWLYPKVSAQLDGLRESFVALLEKHSVDQFELKPGTQLNADSRNRIQLIHIDELDDSKLKRTADKIKESEKTTVLHTVRPGYLYHKDGQTIIIRKAEVVVA